MNDPRPAMRDEFHHLVYLLVRKPNGIGALGILFCGRQFGKTRLLLLTEVASNHRSAVVINAIGEVLASQADPGSLAVLQLPLSDKISLIRCSGYLGSMPSGSINANARELDSWATCSTSYPYQEEADC